jgi:hypothetical protein
MADQTVDVFILFNDREKIVESIVRELEDRGVTTHFWRRDVNYGDEWEKFEHKRLAEAETVLVFLGSAGWGETHLRFTGDAQRLSKRIVPVLIGDFPTGASLEAGELFRVRRYVDLRNVSPDSLGELVAAIRQAGTQQPESAEMGRFDRVVEMLIDGNEEQRADVLRQISGSAFLDKPGLAARLRREIAERFSPASESQFAIAHRDPKKIPSIRSWMLSALIAADVEGQVSRELIRKHLQQSYEPDRNVRFWTLAGLYHRKASWLSEVLTSVGSDDVPDVAMLAKAIASPDDSEIQKRIRKQLYSEKFTLAWESLRVLRVVPMTDLVQRYLQAIKSKGG